MKKQFPITKSINNNIAFSVDEAGKQIIIFGKAIAFGKKSGEMVDASLIEKTFELKDNEQKSMFSQLVENISPEYIEIASEIIGMYEAKMKVELNPMIYISLSDHLDNAIYNYQHEIYVPNEILHEIKRLYPEEFAIAQQGVRLIYDRTGIPLEESEAGFIVMHYLNCAGAIPRNDAKKRIVLVNSIIKIIEDTFSISFDTNSFYYNRFITHMNFFTARLFAPKADTSEDDFLFQIVEGKYPHEQECVCKIDAFCRENYGKIVTNEEKGYLIVHICTLLRKARL